MFSRAKVDSLACDRKLTERWLLELLQAVDGDIDEFFGLVL